MPYLTVLKFQYKVRHFDIFMKYRKICNIDIPGVPVYYIMVSSCIKLLFSFRRQLHLFPVEAQSLHKPAYRGRIAGIFAVVLAQLAC